MTSLFGESTVSVTWVAGAVVLLLAALGWLLYQFGQLRLARARQLDALQDLQDAAADIQHLQSSLSALEQEKDHLSSQLAVASRERDWLQQQLRDQASSMAQWRETITGEFQVLSQKLLRESSQDLVTQNQTAVNNLLQPFRERLSAFQQRINEVHTQAVKDSSAIQTQVNQVMQMGLRMSEEADALTRALKGDKKALGSWGEIQLAQALDQAGMIEGEHFKTQQSFVRPDGKRFIPDVLVQLPDERQLIIDSKVSLNAYHSAVQTQDEAEQLKALQDHVRAVRAHIDDLSRKDYSSLPGIRSLGFVFLFMPIEAAYIALVRQEPDIYRYAFGKNIILSSPSTLLPMLKTVGLLWRVEKGNQQALQLGDRAADLYSQVALLGERFLKLGQNLTTTVNGYNEALRTFSGQRGLVSKVNGFNELSSRTSKRIPDTPEVAVTPDASRLESLADQ